jgi:hypothetical protein
MLIFMQHVSTLPIDMSAHGVPRVARGGPVDQRHRHRAAAAVLAPVLQRLNRSRMLAVGAVLMGAGFGLKRSRGRPRCSGLAS